MRSSELESRGRSRSSRYGALLSRYRALLLLILALAFAVVWQARRGRSALDELRAQLTTSGARLRWDGSEQGWLSTVVRNARLEIQPGFVVEAPEAQVSHRPFGVVSASLPEARWVLRIDPASAFRAWKQSAISRPIPLQALEVSLDYRHPHLRGGLRFSGVEHESQGETEQLRVSELWWGQKHWSQVTLSVSMPHDLLSIAIGEAERGGPHAELRYLPSQGQASQGQATEWVLDLPSQAVGPLRQALALGDSKTDDRARVAGAISVVIPDDGGRAPVANGHFVIDDWFRPPWPQASSLTGQSGSISIKATPEDDTTWRLTRVEVSAGLFELRGTGRVVFGEHLQLSMSVQGSRSCAELAEHLPASVYRDRVLAHLRLAEFKHGAAKRAASAQPVESVELELAVELSDADGGHSRFRWHLGRGCGLDELSAEGG